MINKLNNLSITIYDLNLNDMTIYDLNLNDMYNKCKDFSLWIN